MPEEQDAGAAKSRTYDLEERLLKYATAVVRVTEKIDKTRAGNHVGGQRLRSGTSPSLNHGEAEAAESPDDLAHKMSICLKELRESKRALRLVKQVPLIRSTTGVDKVLSETDELIRIFFASIRTVRRRAAGGVK